LLQIGVFPIRNHYYEPQFDYRNLNLDSNNNRNLSGINWNIEEQLRLLEMFTFSHELSNIPTKKPEPIDFYFNNNTFESGDAEYWYNLIRAIKPKKIFEIGSGNSTLMAIKAVRNNKNENPIYSCKHICIEPFENQWLEKFEIEVIRKKVEDIDLSFFQELEENDILFIDSSHIIRPYGDVVFEYLYLLPSLKNGVIVHIHDIFSPKHYPTSWIKDEVRLWNEQYLLEAFLLYNDSWKILGALNYLHHNYYKNFKAVCPYLSPEKEPGSFYIQKIR